MININQDVKFPITVFFEDKSSELYEDIEDIECNLEDFDSKYDNKCRVEDANGCLLHMCLKNLILNICRLYLKIFKVV